MAIKKNDSPLIELDSTESTNNYAMGLIHEGVAQHGQSVLAHHQTGGKGQRGKTWVSPAGESLSLSIILQPNLLKPAQSFQLLATTAVSIVKVLQKYIGDEVSIKWPNDLYWRDRKAGGILIETIIKGSDFSWVVVGIGINVGQESFSNTLANPVSLKQITGKNIPVKELALEITDQVLKAMNNLKGIGFSDFYTAYNNFLFGKNKIMKFKKESRVFEAYVQNVNQQGQLVTGLNGDICYDFGEVEWKL